MTQCQRIQMARKAGENFELADFKLTDFELPELERGQVLCKAAYISLDPYLAQMMQSWQGPQRDWSQGIIVGRMVGEIIASKDESLQVGDWVTGDSRWQDYELCKAKHLQKIHVDEKTPASAYLGVLGSSGLTAWIGLRRIIDIKAGETLTISSAAGTVGAVAGQLAKITGAKVIGIAGGSDKCNEVVNTLGFDACIDHQNHDIDAQLASLAPEGIHAHYENVGAKTLDPVLNHMVDLGRIGLCGLIAHYLNDEAISLKNFRKILTSGLRLQGFRIYDHFDAAKQAQQELRDGLMSGKISLRETLTEGLENAPAAYIGMLNSSGSGKHLLKL